MIFLRRVLCDGWAPHFTLWLPFWFFSVWVLCSFTLIFNSRFVPPTYFADIPCSLWHPLLPWDLLYLLDWIRSLFSVVCDFMAVKIPLFLNIRTSLWNADLRWAVLLFHYYLYPTSCCSLYCLVVCFLYPLKLYLFFRVGIHMFLTLSRWSLSLFFLILVFCDNLFALVHQSSYLLPYWIVTNQAFKLIWWLWSSTRQMSLFKNMRNGKYFTGILELHCCQTGPRGHNQDTYKLVFNHHTHTCCTRWFHRGALVPIKDIQL